MHGGRRIGLGQKDHNLFTTVPSNEVYLSDRTLAALRELLQDFIADRMPITVIDLLEIVDIEHHTAKGPLHALCPGEFDSAQLKETAAILQARQRIGER
jgi:hypothetical protein